ncbi:MAG: EpsI family protein, partial [Chlorobiales bacterium]|nr:EpsI family protein [Chlorobiales bacterium]
MSTIERAMGIVLTKEPLPLRVPLTALNQDRLAPYRVTETFSIEDQDLLKALGTQDYIQWVLSDPSRDVTDPAREVLLFVTYYALPDKIPHVPEECYLGSGYQRLAADRVTFGIPAEGGSRDVSGRCLVFSQAASAHWGGAARVPVIYLFRVNGQYAVDRDEARLALNRNLFGKASYFSKVELVFNRSDGRITQEQAQAAAQDILRVVLPLLEQEHWPDSSE